MFINATTRQQISIYSIGPTDICLLVPPTFGKVGVQKYEHALNACYWRSANWASIGYRRNGIRTTGAESRIPRWYQRYPVAMFDKKHTSHMSSDAATTVTVEVAMAGGVKLMTDSWQCPCRCRLWTSPGKPRCEHPD